MISELHDIETLTLFVDDLESTGHFYTTVFGLEPLLHDEGSILVKLGGLMLNLLHRDHAPELIAPREAAGDEVGARALLTIRVADVDAVCADLERHGVPLLNGPLDRPWGRRTAAFADPAGNVWEVAQVLPGNAPKDPAA